jgi:hypothetical protein
LDALGHLQVDKPVDEKLLSGPGERSAAGQQGLVSGGEY